MNKSDYFKPENKIADSEKEYLSPSGKYKLITTRFNTGPKSWNYSQGIVYNINSDNPIAIIQRNYGVFPYLFVENHPQGDFLICGENYQGQTIVDLKSGQIIGSMSEGASKGHGFCWSEYRYDETSQILIVNGCYWACPYEFKFFDFSNPKQGFLELMLDKCVDEDSRWPIISNDKIECFQSEFNEESDEYNGSIAAKKTFQRQDNKLVLLEEWVSEKEKEGRRAREEADKKYEEWYENFITTDPLYLTMLNNLKDKKFNTASNYNSIGYTYEGWCEDISIKERRMCRRIIQANKLFKKLTVDLEFGIDKGPIKLVIFKDGKLDESVFFDHSVDDMNKAFNYVEKLL